MLSKATPYVKQFVKTKGVNRQYRIVKDFLDNVPEYMAEAYRTGVPDMVLLTQLLDRHKRDSGENEKENTF